jgi:uncharacterized protein involved in response to NO
MLSNYERRVLNEIEVDLTRKRARCSAVLRACRLPVMLCAAAAVVALSAVRTVSGVPETLLALMLGVIIGWLLVSVVRGRILGPRIRRRLRRSNRPGPGLVDRNDL